MSYWGAKCDENDYAADAIGSVIYLIKKKIEEELSSDEALNYPEQSIIALLAMLRAIGENYPKHIKVHFRKKDLLKVQDYFGKWYKLNEDKLPKNYKEDIYNNGMTDLNVFSEIVFSKK
jgi:hypothetical protein